MRTRCSVLLAAVGLVATCVTQQAYGAVRVERGAGADGCPDAAELAERVRDDSRRRSASPREIAILFERTASGYRSSVRLDGGAPRSIVDEAPNCEGIAEATVLAVRLALDLAAAMPRPAPAPDTPAASAETPAALPALRHRHVVESTIGAVATSGLSAPFAPGVRAGVAFVVPSGSWSIGLTGLVLPAQSHDAGAGTVDIAVVGGGPEGCWRTIAGDSLLLSLCSRVEAMSLDGSARGFPQNLDRARPLLAGSLLGRARLRIAGPIDGSLEAGAVLPFARERFAIDTVGIVYDPPIVAATGAAGIIVHFE